MTVYIYTVPKAVCICKDRKTKEQRNSSLLQVSNRKVNFVGTILSELCTSLVCKVKCHVRVLKVQFPARYFKLHFSAQINSFLVKRGPQTKPFCVKLQLFKLIKTWSGHFTMTEREWMKSQNSFVLF